VSSEAGIAVVVPTFNGAEQLDQLLRSLEDQTVAHEVLVVDNASTDDTATVLGRYNRVTAVKLEANHGFGRAINRGVAATDASTLVFLNNDVVCEPRFLERLCAALEPSAGITMAAGVLLQHNDPGRIDTAGIEFDRTLLAFDYLHGEPAGVLADSPADPIGPCAGAAAFDRHAFTSVGAFDENFFAYLEDVDLVLRLLSAGGRCRLAPEARGVHHHSATLGARSKKKAQLVAWGRGYIIGKYRFHRNPRLLVRTLGTELTGALGKAVADRHAIAVSSQVAGWRAGLRTPAHPLPPLPRRAEEISFFETQRRRIRRRINRAPREVIR
jgi:GT2 family glycosyltransferase